MKKLYINNCNLNNSNNSSAYAKTLIMRPGLLEFLHKMKQIFELVLFSLGTCDYVNKIVNIIEKKEKFFEYILYRQHATFNDNIYIKNLSLLGRDLKNIIIVDDKPQVFKLHQNNGICIKPFYGDVVGERNTLKILGNILQKIRFDADEYEGDIRKSLKYHSGDILTYITSNLESN
jgi:Dullard-like phosphatase family protein